MVDGVAAGAELDVQGSQAGGGSAVVDGDGVVAAAGIVGAGVEREIGDGGEGDGFKGGAAANAGNARLACAGAVEGERIGHGGSGEGEGREGVDRDGLEAGEADDVAADGDGSGTGGADSRRIGADVVGATAADDGERIADGLGAADENDIAGGEGCAVGEINNQLVVTVVAVEGKAGGIGGECIRGLAGGG